jgi:hypothetical protein
MANKVFSFFPAFMSMSRDISSSSAQLHGNATCEGSLWSALSHPWHWAQDRINSLYA